METMLTRSPSPTLVSVDFNERSLKKTHQPRYSIDIPPVLRKIMYISEDLLAEYAPLCLPYFRNFTTISVPTDWIGATLQLTGLRESLKQALFTPAECTDYLVAYVCYKATGIADACADVIKYCPELGITCNSTYVADVYPVRISNPDCPVWAAPDFTNPLLGGGCSPQCPPYGVFPDDLVKAIDYTLIIANIPATFLVALLFLLQLACYKHWVKFPRSYIFACTFCVLLLGISFSFPVITGGIRKFGCKNRTSGNANNDALCTAQAWIIYVASWMQVTLFFIIMLNITLFLTVKNNLQRYLRCLNTFYVLFIVVPPLIIVPIMQGLGKMGYSDGNNICLFANEEVAGIPNGWTMLLLIGPYTVITGATFLLLIPICVVLYRQGRGKMLVRQRRPLTFNVTFGSNIMISICAFWLNIVLQNTIQERAAAYYECLTLQRIQEVTPMLSVGTERIVCDGEGLVTSWFLNYYVQSLPTFVLSFELLTFFGDEAVRCFFKRVRKSTNSGRSSGSGSITGVIIIAKPSPKSTENSGSGNPSLN